MKQRITHFGATLASLLCITILFGCRRVKLSQTTIATKKTKRALTPELDFPVKNNTPQTWYITCFYWAKKLDVPVWRWYKTPIYALEPGQEVIVDVDTFGNQRDRNDIYGWLTVFKTEVEADVATWATTPDEAKVQLNKLSSLKKKKNNETIQYEVILTPEKYGFYGTIIDYTITAREEKKKIKLPELDFWVENQTDDFLYITAFAYQHHSGHMSWIHDSSDIVALPPGSLREIDIETVEEEYDWKNIHGHLALFKTQGATHPRALRGEAHDTFTDMSHKLAELEKSHSQAIKKAQNATYELLEPGQNIKLPRLKKILGKKIVLRKKPYGLVVDRKRREKTYFIEYTIEDLPGSHSKNSFDKVSDLESLSGESGQTTSQ